MIELCIVIEKLTVNIYKTVMQDKQRIPFRWWKKRKEREWKYFKIFHHREADV